MNIFLIRHGETTGDVEGRYGGDYEDHLTEKGKQQAQELAKTLTGKGIQIIFHSPRIRARETAEILHQAISAPLEEVKDLRERNNYGILTGLTKDEALKSYPDQVTELERGTKLHRVKGSEDYDTFRQRVIAGLEHVSTNGRATSVAVITHSGPIRCIGRDVLGIGEFNHIGDCAIVEIMRENGTFKMKRMHNAKLERPRV